MKRDKSILQSNRGVCYLCGKRASETHETMYGWANRKLSIKYGLYVDLCHDCHEGIHTHRDEEKNELLHIKSQEAFEAIYGHDEWMRLYGRNYL